MFAMLAVFLIFQIVIMRGKFQWVQLSQLLVAWVYSEMTDLTLWLIRGLEVNSYMVRWILCIISFWLVAIGVVLEVCSDMSSLAGDGLMKIIAQKSQIEFGKIKIMFDCGFAASSIVIGLIAFHKVEGVREGTVAAAIFVGLIVRLIYWISFVKPFLPVNQNIKNEKEKNYE